MTSFPLSTAEAILHLLLPSPGPSVMNLLPEDLPTLLEALINDCFQSTVDSTGLSTDRMEYVSRFHKFLVDCHSHENLAFLIEIYRYEYFYDKLVGKRCVSHDSSESHSEKNIPLYSLVDPSMELFIGSLPYPTLSMNQHLRKSPMPSRSQVSLSSALTGTAFVLEIDEPASDLVEAWHRFGASHVSPNLDSDSDSGTNYSVDCGLLLLAQWRHIMATYIEEQSESQLNLPNSTSRGLVECDRNQTRPPCPCVLKEAKRDVMRLIYENTYPLFTKMMRSCNTDASCECASSLAGSAGSVVGLSVSLAVKSRPVPFNTGAYSVAQPMAQSMAQTGQSVSTPSNGSPVAAFAQKRRSKFLLPFSGHGGHASESSASPLGSLWSGSHLSGLISHLKPNYSSSGLPRTYNSAPHSPAPSETAGKTAAPFPNLGPDDLIPRPRSTVALEGSSNPSILGKIWRKRR